MASRLAQVPVTVVLHKCIVVSSSVGTGALLNAVVPTEAAVRTDFVRQRAKACLTRSTFSSNVLGRPLLPLPNTIPVTTKFLRHARTEGRYGGSLPHSVLWFR